MAKFKVGDKVRVVSIHPFTKWIGKVVRIDDNLPSIPYAVYFSEVSNGFNFAPEELELVKQ